MKVTILGCGGSDGVPLIGGPDGAGEWGACDPTNPRNRRTRVSILVEEGAESLLVDTSPDLRQQMLDNRLHRVTAVLFTHEHADHSHGLHEIRRLSVLNKRRPMDIWASPETLAFLHERFGYAFRQLRGSPYPEILCGHEINGPFTVGGVHIVPFAQDHGFGNVTLGFRFGPVAYTTDAVELSDDAFAVLAGVDTWIVDCQQMDPHPSHAHFDKTMAWIERAGVRRAVLTHMGPRLDYETLRRLCPPHVTPGYDGMVLDF